MTAIGGEPPVTLAHLSLAEIRAELLDLLTLADTSVKPLPDRPVPEYNAFAPGLEWRVRYRDERFHDPRLMWSVIARASDDVKAAIYVHTPDSLDGDYLCLPTTEARALAMALLAASDRADHEAAGIPDLADRRKQKNSRRREMT